MQGAPAERKIMMLMMALGVAAIVCWNVTARPFRAPVLPAPSTNYSAEDINAEIAAFRAASAEHSAYTDRRILLLFLFWGIPTMALSARLHWLRSRREGTF